MAESTTADGYIYYQDRGEGPGDPVVLLHAFPLNGKMWEPQVDFLSGSRRVIVPDYPGFGRSPHAPAQPDVDYYAAEIQSLLDRLGLERVVLGGISMGGYVAFAALRLFPERMSALLLANTRPDADNADAREARNTAVRRVAEEGVEVLPALQMERLLSENTREKNPRLVERVRNLMLESSPDGVVAALGALRERPDVTGLLPGIGIPTLVIGGEEDDISNPEIMGEMADSIPDARHVTLSGAAHLSNLEAPARFNDALGEFLAGIR